MAARNNGSATRNSSNVHVELRCEMGASPSRSVASGLTLCPPLVAPLARRGLQPLSPSRSRSSSCEFDQAASLQRALVGLKKACHGRLFTSRRPRQCSTPRGRTVARTCSEKETRTWWQAGGRAAALHRAERRTLAVRARAATDLLGLDLGVVPTARRSHTTGLGRAPMRPPHVSCQEVDPFAGGRPCSTWRAGHPSNDL